MGALWHRPDGFNNLLHTFNVNKIQGLGGVHHYPG